MSEVVVKRKISTLSRVFSTWASLRHHAADLVLAPREIGKGTARQFLKDFPIRSLQFPGRCKLGRVDEDTTGSLRVIQLFCICHQTFDDAIDGNSLVPSRGASTLANSRDSLII